MNNAAQSKRMNALSNLRRIVATLEEHLWDAQKEQNDALAYACSTILAAIQDSQMTGGGLTLPSKDGKLVITLDLVRFTEICLCGAPIKNGKCSVEGCVCSS